MGRSRDWKEECKVITWMQKVQHCASTLLAVQQMDKNPGNYSQQVQEHFIPEGRMASKGKEHASISKGLKHQLWDMMGTLRGHRNGKASSPCSLSPQEPWTSCSSAHKVLHWVTSDFYHFLHGCTSKVRADQVFQRNLYMHVLTTLLLGHLSCWVLSQGTQTELFAKQIY